MVSPRAFAADVHARFRVRPGSAHIATQTAIEGLVRWLRRRCPERVLEIGAGIGTLTFATVETLDAVHGRGAYQLTTTECHAFCLEQLSANLMKQQGRYTVVSSPSEALDDGPFDFLIADGGDPSDTSAFQCLARGAVVFIEGDRKPQAAALEAALAGRRWQSADIRTLRRRDLPEGGRAYDGGYRIYALEPAIGTRLLLCCRRVATSLVFRLRPLLR